MTQHELKILPEYFVAVANGTKTFEVRKDDRPFEVGDILCLHEINCGVLTGRTIKAEVTYVLRHPDYCKEGYCILSIKVAQQQTVKQLVVELNAKGKEVPEKVRYVSVDYDDYGFDDKGNIIYDTAYCPVCNYKFAAERVDHDNYCRRCGQKLDWSP